MLYYQIVSASDVTPAIPALKAAAPEKMPRRVVIEAVSPTVDQGVFAAKAIAGEAVPVEADIFLDGQDEIGAVVQYRRRGGDWQESPMSALGNDRWRGEFTPAEPGEYEFRVEAWPDAFQSWRRDLKRRLDAGQDLSAELVAGAVLVVQAASRAAATDRRGLEERASALGKDWDSGLRAGIALEDTLAVIMARYADRRGSTTIDPPRRLVVDRERALYGSWYEMFPRSASPDPGRPGTLADVIARLDYVAEMGFDVLYLPPVHPVGRTNRKGHDNANESGAEAPGSPWAIGSEAGGHKAIDPDLGTMPDFCRLVDEAASRGIEIAMDLAFQCSPDHPYVREHREWFRRRPDGTIRHAENPPKKYEDIYPFDLECEDWQALWSELKSVVDFWVGHGIRLFRVDNPHTKPFAFWEWLIGETKREHPDIIFLAEAFTRPKVMFRLAKVGFSQSYTYFTWRNTKAEIVQYFEELCQPPVGHFFRPNLWPNTPDILHEYLQTGGRAAFIARLVLAATLGASYGIYGPAFELCEARPREPGSEEYLNSEKYEVRHWDLAGADSLRGVIARVNRIRRENAPLRANASLRFHPVDNESLIAYTKSAPRGQVVLTVVNLDPRAAQAGWVQIPLGDLGVDAEEPYQVHDLLSDERYVWQGARNFVMLDPNKMPAHVFRLRRRAPSEKDFDYYV